jgi:hypothetical protein
MNAGAALVDEASDCRVWRRRLQQLQRRTAGGDEVCAHVLLAHLLRHMDVQAERVAVERQRGVDVAHRNPNVVEHRPHDSVTGGAGSGSTLFITDSTAA